MWSATDVGNILILMLYPSEHNLDSHVCVCVCVESFNKFPHLLNIYMYIYIFTVYVLNECILPSCGLLWCRVYFIIIIMIFFY